MQMALYRKWRPARFAEVVGQDAVVSTLLNQLADNRVFHAYIFTGIRGTGKTTLARLLAKAVNCLDPKDGEPCGECEICRGIDNGSILDVTEIDAASFTGVDNIRELRDETAFYPVRCKKRVYIIDEVHMLSVNAFNALLKIMEEPPEHVMFILATTEIYKVPPTVLSRCIRFDLRRLTPSEIAQRIAEIARAENIELDKEAALLIGRLADGAMRDAISLLETCVNQSGHTTCEDVMRAAGVTDSEHMFAIAQSLADGDTAGVLQTVAQLYDNSLEPARICTLLARHLRSVLLSDISPQALSEQLSESAIEKCRAQAKLFDRQSLIDAVKKLNNCGDTMPKSADKRLALEITLVELCEAGKMPEAEKPAPRTMPAKSVNRPAAPAKSTPKSAESEEELSPPWDPDEPQAPAETEQNEQAVWEQHEDTAEPKPATKTKPPKQTEDGRFAAWINVIAALRTANPMLFAALDGSAAYLSENRLLIQADESFYELMRIAPQAKTQLKEIIAKVTDCTLPIGPYLAHQEAPNDNSDPQRENAEKILEKARDLGIETNHIGG